MTFTAKTTLAAATLVGLTACMPMTETASMGGMTYQQALEVYPDLSAVEFSVLDDNNDGMLDETERMDIDSDDSNVGAIEVDNM